MVSIFQIKIKKKKICAGKEKKRAGRGRQEAEAVQLQNNKAVNFFLLKKNNKKFFFSFISRGSCYLLTTCLTVCLCYTSSHGRRLSSVIIPRVINIDATYE